MKKLYQNFQHSKLCDNVKTVEYIRQPINAQVFQNNDDERLLGIYHPD